MLRPKTLCVVLFVIGVLVTIAFVYRDQLNEYVTPDTTFDTVILLHSLGLSLLFLPIGIAVGLGCALVLHLAWKLSRQFLGRHGSGSPDAVFGSRTTA